MSACRTLPPPDICPTQDETREQLFALLPRGKAWATPQGSVRWAFFHALAAPIAFANARICALIEEFFCATAVETHDVWLATYGLPDGCDPFPDLCTKVAALGGANCIYWTAIAARAGWSIACVELGPSSTDNTARAGCAAAGCAQPGSGVVSTALAGRLLLRVFLSASPAYGGQAGAQQALSGLMLSGGRLSCPPDISALLCLMARILPAHLQVSYEVMS